MSGNELRYVIAVGASAGGLNPIMDLVKGFPKEFDAPVVVAVHSSPDSVLSDVLARFSVLPVKELEDGEKLQRGRVYAVPGARHAFFRKEGVQLSEVVEESGFRPSIDALFMSLAAEYGRHAIAIILSGAMKDGMRGAQIIYDMGGITLVQDPDEANFKTMPQSAILADHPRKVLPAAELGPWLAKYVGKAD